MTAEADRKRCQPNKPVSFPKGEESRMDQQEFDEVQEANFQELLNEVDRELFDIDIENNI